MEVPNGRPEILRLKDLPDEYYRLQFLVSAVDAHARWETKVSVEAGEIIGRIHMELLKQYVDSDSAESQHSLNVFCVRLVFLPYADSSGILGPRGIFRSYLADHRKNARVAFIRLFEVLDSPRTPVIPIWSQTCLPFRM